MAQTLSQGRGLALQPSMGWYAPAFSFYNEQYETLDDIPFTNDIANSYRIPHLKGGRELAFAARWHFGGHKALGARVSGLSARVSALLNDPPPSPGSRLLNYSHEIKLTPVLVSAYLYFPLSHTLDLYAAQGIGVAWVRETIEVTDAGQVTFADRNRSLGVLVAPLLGLQHRISDEAFLFAEFQYVFGGYSAQDWQPARDPFKSIFIRRGQVSLSGPSVKLGLGFVIRGK